MALLEAKGNEGIVLAFSARDVIDAGGRRILRARSFAEGRHARDDVVRRNVRAGTNIIGEPAAVTFRANIARAAGKLEPSAPYVMDIDYWVRLLEYGDAFAFSRPQCAFRLWGANMTVRLRAQRRRQYLTMIERMRALPWSHVSATDRAMGTLRVHINEIARSLVHLVAAARAKKLSRGAP